MANQVKFFEVRDRATFISCVGIALNGSIPLAARAGFGERCILFGRLEGGQFEYNAYGWNNRTMHVAHIHISAQWDDLADHSVIDVEYILGETQTPKASEL